MVKETSHAPESPAYAIVFLKGGTILRSTPWVGDLSSAKRHAQAHFAFHRTHDGATEVVVLDDDDDLVKKVLFSYSGGAVAQALDRSAGRCALSTAPVDNMELGIARSVHRLH